MVGTDEPGIGGPSEEPGKQGLAKGPGNAGPSKGREVRKVKAAAARGPAPKRKKFDDCTEIPETSKVAQKKQRKEKKDDIEDIRNRASPFRLATVNDGLNGKQKMLLIKWHFGGLLNIASSMNVELSQWVMRCYDPIKSELVIPERGRIPVNAESVSLMWDLPSSGLKVCWDIKPDVIRTVNKKFDIDSGSPPDLTTWCKKIKDMEEADDKFLQAYSMVAYSCLFAPTTGVKVCARCYPATSDPELVDQYNISQFVVDRIREEFMALGNKKSVCCFVYHLLLQYLDSLEVDVMISDCTPRANAWDADLITTVLKKDRLGAGVFGKLQLKEKYRDTAQGGLFGGLLRAEQFVGAILPGSYDHKKKRKLSAMVHAFCTEFEDSMTKWVKGIGSLDEASTSGTKHTGRSAAKNGKKTAAKRQGTKQPAAKRRCTKQQQEKEQLLPEESDDADSDTDSNQDFVLDDDDSDKDEDDPEKEDDNKDVDDDEESDSDNNDEDDEGCEDGDDEDRDNTGGNGGGDSNNDNDDGGGGGNTGLAGGGPEVHPDSCDGRSGTSVPDTTTKQFVYQKRKPGNAKPGGKSKDGAAGEGEPAVCGTDDMSLFDMCTMEVPSRLPDIPLFEVNCVWDERPSTLMRNLCLDSLRKEIPSYEGEQTILDGVCTPSAYNDWFEESHGLRPAGRTSISQGAPTLAATTGQMSASKATSAANGATLQPPGATVPSTQATLHSPGATVLTTEATLHSPGATAPSHQATLHSTGATAPSHQGTAPAPKASTTRTHAPPATAARNSSPAATRLEQVAEKNSSMLHPKSTQQAVPATADFPTPQASKAPIHETSVMRATSSTSSPRVNYNPPTPQNFPPPAPSNKKQANLSQDDVYSMISKLSIPTPKTQLKLRTKSAESGLETRIDHSKLPSRRNSGSEVAEPFSDWPSFSLGPDFVEDTRSCSSGAPKWDMTPRPTERPEHVVQSSFSSGGPEWDKTPGPTESPAAGEQGVQIIDSALMEACIEAEKNYRSKEKLVPASIDLVSSPSDFHTPAKLPEQVEGDYSSAGTKSSSGPQLHARRISKPTPAMQSPYNSKKQYNCSVEVNKLYALVLQHGRRGRRGPQQEDLSPDIIDYGKYHITLLELSESMKPGGWLHTSVMEIGIQFLTKTLPSLANKVIMPLRIATHMLNMEWDGVEIKELFANDKRLDKKDMIMFPVIQPLNPKSEVVVHHYFLFNINIRDKKFQVLDSWRTLKDKLLKSCVDKLKATAYILWDDNYPNSKVKLETFRTEEVDVPKQINNDDCGVCTLMNAELWEGRFPPNYSPKDLPNIRKLMTNNWVTALQNIIDWRAALKRQ